MPVLEYVCSQCGSLVDKKQKGDAPECPACGSFEVQEKGEASPSADSASCSPKG